MVWDGTGKGGRGGVEGKRGVCLGRMPASASHQRPDVTNSQLSLMLITITLIMMMMTTGLKISPAMVQIIRKVVILAGSQYELEYHLQQCTEHCKLELLPTKFSCLHLTDLLHQHLHPGHCSFTTVSPLFLVETEFHHSRLEWGHSSDISRSFRPPSR